MGASDLLVSYAKDLFLLEPPWPEDPEPDLAASQPSGLTNRRMRTRMSGGVRGGGATRPYSILRAVQFGSVGP
jgi:hypothetical protein